MARIRTIKPEFPQSESMGRVTRDARLLFVQIWTICDDSGRARATSRMLASLLYPYDDDAPRLIDGWLKELQDERCIELYEVDGKHYLEVCKWLEHQKIDKPSKSHIPEFVESSRIFANPLEVSSEEGTKDQGPRTKEGSARKPSKVPPRKTLLPENFRVSKDVAEWAKKNGHSDLPKRLEHFVGTARAKAYQYVNWDQAFMNAIRDDWAKIGPPTNGSNAHHTESLLNESGRTGPLRLEDIPV